MLMMAVLNCAVQLNNTLKDGCDGKLGAYFMQLRKKFTAGVAVHIC